MTYRLTFWEPLCNGEGMHSSIEIEASDEAAARAHVAQFFEKYPHLASEGIGRTPRLEAVSPVAL